MTLSELELVCPKGVLLNHTAHGSFWFINRLLMLSVISLFQQKLEEQDFGVRLLFKQGVGNTLSVVPYHTVFDMSPQWLSCPIHGPTERLYYPPCL